MTEVSSGASSPYGAESPNSLPPIEAPQSEVPIDVPTPETEPVTVLERHAALLQLADASTNTAWTDWWNHPHRTKADVYALLNDRDVLPCFQGRAWLFLLSHDRRTLPTTVYPGRYPHDPEQKPHWFERVTSLSPELRAMLMDVLRAMSSNRAAMPGAIWVSNVLDYQLLGLLRILPSEQQRELAGLVEQELVAHLRWQADDDGPTRMQYKPTTMLGRVLADVAVDTEAKGRFSAAIHTALSQQMVENPDGFHLTNPVSRWYAGTISQYGQEPGYPTELLTEGLRFLLGLPPAWVQSAYTFKDHPRDIYHGPSFRWGEALGLLKRLDGVPELGCQLVTFLLEHGRAYRTKGDPSRQDYLGQVHAWVEAHGSEELITQLGVLVNQNEADDQAAATEATRLEKLDKQAYARLLRQV